jgi:hypothetical protein
MSETQVSVSVQAESSGSVSLMLIVLVSYGRLPSALHALVKVSAHPLTGCL